MDGVLAGVCQFKLSAEGGIICDFASAKDYEGDLFEPLFVMGRGTLNLLISAAYITPSSMRISPTRV